MTIIIPKKTNSTYTSHKNMHSRQTSLISSERNNSCHSTDTISKNSFKKSNNLNL